MFIREARPPTTHREQLQAKSVIRPTYQTLKVNQEPTMLTRRTAAQVTETLRHIQQVYSLERRTFL